MTDRPQNTERDPLHDAITQALTHPPCRVCGKPHELRETGRMVTWASPDGHAYEPTFRTGAWLVVGRRRRTPVSLMTDRDELRERTRARMEADRSASGILTPEPETP